MMLGSRLGCPVVSINAPSGAGSPLFLATRILPIATKLVAKSSTVGGFLSVAGMTAQYGLVM